MDYFSVLFGRRKQAARGIKGLFTNVLEDEFSEVRSSNLLPLALVLVA